MRIAPRFSFLFVTLMLATSCGGNGVTSPLPYCTSTRPIAISISVRDSVTQQAIADSASGSLFSVNGTETLLRADTLTLFGGTRLGSYDVAVQRAGFRTWSRANVQVTKTGFCGNPETVLLTAKLQRP
jgi:hypothetical protein